MSERYLILIVAYEAERHLAGVLNRIPAEFINTANVHILVIDDASSDQSPEAGQRWANEHDCKNITILRNPINQGYGGNQKIGYRLAIDGGFDFVILLHGDGQYAPELLPEFIRLREQANVDVILGSRMQSLRSARRGGMPWYKLVGNRILTYLQNRLTGKSLSEYHTGYRGYSTRFLSRIPFEIDTNDFHFDTEILLQAFHTGATIAEFPIPTRYGDEICRVNGLRYAKDVLAATLRYRFHQFGMLCDLRYHNHGAVRYADKTHIPYSSHAMALRLIDQIRPVRLMDIGCGAGFITRRCEQMGISVTALDYEQPAAGMTSHFRKLDLERDPVPSDALEHDMLLLLDVIEHLKEPEQFLLDLRNRCLLPEDSSRRQLPAVLISTPNVAFASVRLGLLLGRFNYAERGILDITHKRLFTRRSLLDVLEQCGFDVQRCMPVGVPFGAVVGGRIGRLLNATGTILARLWPTMFAFQFMVLCRPRPGVRQLLAWSDRRHVPSPLIASVIDAVSKNADLHVVLDPKR